MSFHYGTPDRGAVMQGARLTVKQDGRYTEIDIDVELRDRLLLELLSDDVIDGPEQNLACALYNAICARVDKRAEDPLASIQGGTT